jgi:lipopolysaccharide export system protein LptA
MKMNAFAKLVAAVALIALPLMKTTALAEGNVNVEADAMEIIDAEHKTIFTGNVVAKRPTDTIRADEMIVSSAEQKQTDGTTKSVTDFVNAKGNVTINTKNATITGDWCRFDVLNNQLVVGGNVVLTQGSSVVKGKKLNVDLKTSHLQMSGGRVSGTFVPK